MRRNFEVRADGGAYTNRRPMLSAIFSRNAVTFRMLPTLDGRRSVAPAATDLAAALLRPITVPPNWLTSLMYCGIGVSWVRGRASAGQRSIVVTGLSAAARPFPRHLAYRAEPF